MLTCQKHKFSIPSDVSYFNCAYMSPLLKSVEAAGIQGVSRKSAPFKIFNTDFFEPVDEVRKLFSELINAQDFERIAVIPSVSYGIANCIKNIPIEKGQNIVIIEEQFPSNYYSWKRLEEEKGVKIRITKAPTELNNRGKVWNEQLLNHIDKNTAAVSIPIVHWADGTKFDIKAISQKCKEVGAYFIIDGTQSVGALPFDIQEIKPDALICVAYKWLLGPYSFGVAYYGERFDNGIPIEENWINRKGSDDFRKLVNYQSEYRPKAFRYSVGEPADFIALPMLKESLKQLLEWGPKAIQDYCENLAAPYLAELKDMGCQIEDSNYRGHHLFGIRLGEEFDIGNIKQEFEKNNLFISLRGSAVRVAAHVFNEEKDFEKLLKSLKAVR